MAKKRKETIELRVYEVPQGHTVLALYGSAWVRTYGQDQTSMHFHNLMEIGICRYGKGILATPDGNIDYTDGTITVVPANYPHTTVSEGEDVNFWEYLFFDPKTIVNELYGESPVYANEVVSVLNRRCLVVNEGDYPDMASLINSVINESREKKKFHHIACSHYMRVLIIELMRMHEDTPYYAEGPAKTNNAVQISAAIDYIMMNLDQPIKVADLADACNMSETHFRRIFDDYVDMSPMDYVNLCRIQKACEIMKKGTESMEIVAEKCGFLNVSTFNRNFKKFIGITPYQWKIGPENYEVMLTKYHIAPRQGW